MNQTDRIRVAGRALLAALGVLTVAVLVGYLTAWVSVPADTQFKPGTGVYKPVPAGETGSGLHLPLGGER